MKTFLWGEEDFLIWRKISNVKDDFKKKNPQALCREFDLEEDFDKDRLTEVFSQGGSLFSQKELFILGNIFSLSLSQQKELKELLSGIDFDSERKSIILFHKGSLKKYKNNHLCKFLLDGFDSVEFNKISSAKITNWLLEEAELLSGNKINIDKPVCERLILFSQSNLWFLHNEIKKLINYIGNRRTIKMEDLEKVSCGKMEAKIFDLVDAIGQRNKKRSIDLVSSLTEQGLKELYIFSMIVFQLRNLAKIHDIKRENNQWIAKKTKLHPFVIEKAKRQLANFSRQEIRRAYDKLAEFDHGFKTGKINPKKALYDLVISI
jgi:DNA polymerase-3 subunit delta